MNQKINSEQWEQNFAKYIEDKVNEDKKKFEEINISIENGMKSSRKEYKNKIAIMTIYTLIAGCIALILPGEIMDKMAVVISVISIFIAVLIYLSTDYDNYTKDMEQIKQRLNDTNQESTYNSMQTLYLQGIYMMLKEQNSAEKEVASSSNQEDEEAKK